MIKVEAKCDRCKKDYTPYYPKKRSETPFYNGLMMVTFDARNNYHRKENIDLCPSCASEFLSWVLDGAVQEPNQEVEANESVE